MIVDVGLTAWARAKPRNAPITALCSSYLSGNSRLAGNSEAIRFHIAKQTLEPCKAIHLPHLLA